MKGWLGDAGSLTARLRARCDDFAVSVLRQGMGRVLPDEAPLLGLKPGDSARVREVLLHADGVPVVYARSVMPLATVRAGSRLFARIGSRPLGELLFANPRIERGELTSARLDARDARQRAALAAIAAHQPPLELWGRRSVFRLRGRALLVTEIFLPDILKLPA